MHGNVYWFSLIGQVLGIIGAIYTMLRQSRDARMGPGLIAAAFLLQAIATFISK